MTQTLDVRQQTSQPERAHATSGATARTTDKVGTFVFAFGIAFATLYTVFEQLNWPFFTYHPAVGKLDFWMQPPRRGEGPPMYWYGWLTLSFVASVALGWIATIMSRQWLERATIFGCVLAALWPAVFGLLVYTANRVSFDAEFLKSIWLAAVPAFAGAAAITYCISDRWAERLWPRLLMIMPIGGLVVLGISLRSFFLR